MATQETIEAVADTVEVIEDTLETLERIPKVHLNGTTKGQQILILAVTAGVSAAAGGGATYFFLNKKLKFKYEQIAEAEIEEARQHYRAQYKAGEFSDPREALQAMGAPVERTLDEVVDALEYRSGEHTPPTEAEVEAALEQTAEETAARLEDIEGRTLEVVKDATQKIENIFENPMEMVFDIDKEMENRLDPTVPYIISMEEFRSGPSEYGYDQATLTYFDGDGILCDEHDHIINETDSRVGDMNLTKFGYGSNDANVVYVRNEQLELDFEVLRSGGKYSVEVAGFDEDAEEEKSLRHSSRRPFRRSDRE